jgi:hypothetical protein
MRREYEMDLKEIETEGLAWIHLAHVRAHLWVVMNLVMNLQVAKRAGNSLTT